MFVRKIAILMSIIIVCLCQLQAQSERAGASTERKITERVAPVYPELAKRMHIRGVVKIETVVRPNGTVKSTRVLGGSPVLVEAASDAVKKWKFEPAPTETVEILQLAFEGQ